MVGAVIVRGGEVVGEGWHRKVGAPHAEAEALAAAGDRAAGSEVFVTLEPCVHHGRTPPCTDALIGAGVARVVVGMQDPDPKVSGKGMAALREAGIEVALAEGDPCRELYAEYVVHRTSGRPHVTLKAAASLDGKVAAADGSSRWVTSEEARVEAHRLRSRCDAICVGVGTILADDPMLTTRHVKGADPMRVVFDTEGRMPIDARVLQPGSRTVVFAAKPVPGLAAAGAEVVVVDRDASGVSVEKALEWLGREGIVSILVEGGPTLAGSFIERDLVDRFVFFVAPKLLGGPRSAVAGWEAPSVDKAYDMDITGVKRVGPDLMVTAEPRRG